VTSLILFQKVLIRLGMCVGIVDYSERQKNKMQNSTTLCRIEKYTGDRIKRIYADKLFTLELNNGQHATVYIDNKQAFVYSGEGAWALAQTKASELVFNLDMGDL